MRAIQFGAGNIGRGFIGLLLNQAGYEVVFADVNPAVIEALNEQRGYHVHQVGKQPRSIPVSGVRGVNSAADPQALVAELATADVATTAVGPAVLKFIAPPLVAALRARTSPAPLAIMACENAVFATDRLRDEMRALVDPAEWDELAARAVFANTAVDRIVPAQSTDTLDVTVEDFCEWTVEKTPFGTQIPAIPGAHFVADLQPYIERKLFTVNTGHAATAYLGFANGHEFIADAIREPAILRFVSRALRETSELLIAKHGLSPTAQTEYRETILNRFANRLLPDTVERVGRSPLRKLSRAERFIAPAAECAERGLAYDGLIEAIAAALRFDVADDEESVRMQANLSGMTASEFVAAVCGIAPEHPLFPALITVVERRKLAL